MKIAWTLSLVCNYGNKMRRRWKKKILLSQDKVILLAFAHLFIEHVRIIFFSLSSFYRIAWVPFKFFYSAYVLETNLNTLTPHLLCCLLHNKKLPFPGILFYFLEIIFFLLVHVYKIFEFESVLITQLFLLFP